MGLDIKAVIEAHHNDTRHKCACEKCTVDNTVICEDMTARMPGWIGKPGKKKRKSARVPKQKTLRVVCRMLYAHIDGLFEHAQTVVLCWEIDTHVPASKHTTLAERRETHTPLSRNELQAMYRTTVIPWYNRIRATKGVRDTLFNQMSHYIRTEYPVKRGKMLVVGATACTPNVAHIKVCGEDWQRWEVPCMGEADISLAYWSLHFRARPRIIVANDCDMVCILTLNALRNLNTENGTLDVPIFLFRHRYSFPKYMRLLDSTAPEDINALKEASGYELPFTDIRHMWHSIYKKSARTRDPSPLASFAMLMALHKCDYIKTRVCYGMGSKTLYDAYLERTLDAKNTRAFVELVYAQDESGTIAPALETTITGDVDAFLGFLSYLRDEKKKKLPPLGEDMHRAAFRRALWVLDYWSNALLTENTVTNPLLRVFTSTTTIAVTTESQDSLSSMESELESKPEPERESASVWGWTKDKETGAVRESGKVTTEIHMESNIL